MAIPTNGSALRDALDALGEIFRNGTLSDRIAGGAASAIDTKQGSSEAADTDTTGPSPGESTPVEAADSNNAASAPRKVKIRRGALPRLAHSPAAVPEESPASVQPVWDGASTLRTTLGGMNRDGLRQAVFGNSGFAQGGMVESMTGDRLNFRQPTQRIPVALEIQWDIRDMSYVVAFRLFSNTTMEYRADMSIPGMNVTSRDALRREISEAYHEVVSAFVRRVMDTSFAESADRAVNELQNPRLR